MTIIQKDEYVFEVDVEKTKNYYKAHSLCNCDYCKNYYAQIKGKFPKLEAFLSEFGIDIEKPDEIMSVESDDKIDYINIDYTVNGKITAMGQYEIDIQDELFLSLVITDGYASPNEQTSDYFTISVYNIQLPWILDKLFPLSIHFEPTQTNNCFWNIFKRKNQIQKDPEECLENIKRKIFEKTGISKCIDLDETSVAFSGTVDNYDLYLSLSVIEKNGKNHLYAYMEDRLDWNEKEFHSQDEFENAIVAFICPKINRTIKTITETKRHKYIRVTEYYLDKETNEWVLMSDDKLSWLIMRPIIEEDSITEEIKEYHI